MSVWQSKQIGERLRASPLTAAEVDRIAHSGGLRAPQVEALVQLWLQGASVGSADERASGPHPAKIAVVAPGNLFVATWQPIIEGLALGAEVVVRASQRDRDAPDVLRRWLHRAVPELAPRLRCVTFPRDDEGSWRRLLSDVDAAVVQGSSTACEDLKGVRDRCSPGLPIRAQGHRLSLSLVSGPPSKPLCDRLAFDALVSAGRGCMAPRVVIHRGGGDLRDWVEPLSDALQGLSDRWQLPAFEQLDGAWRHAVELHRLEAALAGGRLLEPALSAAQLLIRLDAPIDRLTLSHLPPAGPALWLLASEAPAARLLAPVSRWLSVVTVDADSEPLREALYEAGALRVDEIGRAQSPPWGVTCEMLPLGAELL